MSSSSTTAAAAAAALSEPDRSKRQKLENGSISSSSSSCVKFQFPFSSHGMSDPLRIIFQFLIFADRIALQQTHPTIFKIENARHRCTSWLNKKQWVVASKWGCPITTLRVNTDPQSFPVDFPVHLTTLSVNYVSKGAWKHEFRDISVLCLEKLDLFNFPVELFIKIKFPSTLQHLYVTVQNFHLPFSTLGEETERCPQLMNLPDSLLSLTYGVNAWKCHSMSGEVFPSSLECLELCGDIHLDDIRYPNCLKTLKVNLSHESLANKLKTLPPTITNLQLIPSQSDGIDLPELNLPLLQELCIAPANKWKLQVIPLINLPLSSTLTRLTIPVKYFSRFQLLTNLEDLVVDLLGSDDWINTCIFPDSLKSLVLLNASVDINRKAWPLSLERLVAPCLFSKECSIPSTLKYMKTRCLSTERITLPDSLLALALAGPEDCSCVFHPHPINLPSQLRCLYVNLTCLDRLRNPPPTLVTIFTIQTDNRCLLFPFDRSSCIPPQTKNLYMYFGPGSTDQVPFPSDLHTLHVYGCMSPNMPCVLPDRLVYFYYDVEQDDQRFSVRVQHDMVRVKHTKTGCDGFHGEWAHIVDMALSV